MRNLTDLQEFLEKIRGESLLVANAINSDAQDELNEKLDAAIALVALTTETLHHAFDNGLFTVAKRLADLIED